MIANKSIHYAISFIHFTIALFCLSIFMLYVSQQWKWSLYLLFGKKESFFIILLGIVSLLSFFGALSWQTSFSKTSQKISFLISLFFLIEYIAIFFIAHASDAFIIALVPTITPAMFLFLLAFSKANQFQENRIEYANNYLDSDFLVDKEKSYISIFWKPNRIVSFTSFVFTILLFLSLMVSNAPFGVFFIPLIFLGLAVTLLLFPKIGSWICAIAVILMGMGLVGAFIFLIITKPFNNNDEMYILGFVSLSVLSLAALGGGIAMLLLSKEAKQEWKMKTRKNH